MWVGIRGTGRGRHMCRVRVRLTDHTDYDH